MSRPETDFDHRVQHARRLMQEGREIPPQLLADRVRRSWSRSREYGVSESARVVFDPLGRSALRRLADEHRALLAHAEPEMLSLFGTLDASSWVVACLEAGGAVLKSCGGNTAELGDIATALRPGVNLSEQVAGTNGPGCVLAEQRPAIIHGGEHFLEEIRGFTCVAVPIFHPSGRLIGALNASRRHDGRRAGILEPLALAARAIENRLLSELAAPIRMRVHSTPELVDSVMAGRLACSADGLILGASSCARQLLGLEQDGGEIPAAAVFSTSFGELVDLLRRGADGPVTVRCNNGVQVHLRLDAEARPRPARRIGTEATRGDQHAARMRLDSRLQKDVRQAERAFAHDLPVLINGETGTGKEVLARHLHASGPRRDGAFVAVNCSAIPVGLIESELFGYEDGAFTGARRGGMAGKLEQADGGTLFLDEIGDMPLELQARLLRVLQERTVTRLGSTRARAFDCSLICATHRDLSAHCASGGFREDLYYRIAGLRVDLPPLREREDFDELVDHLLATHARGAPPRLAERAREALRRHRWPGNIRELQQVLRLGIALAEHGRIDLDQLPASLATQAPLKRTPGTATTLQSAECDAVQAAYARNRGNVSATARELGIARATLYRKLRRYGCAD
ncbi:sigma-54-dependent transcriptional regulator [Azoarcus olearius]|uniref:sigma-54-dependent Fis family transcriptional regulator n=1 Tax=Azoarcus sp. (strain BH72) TaxID=418699 RepID=UPI00080631E3|nr:sigma-54-dependent Fis family transcriptional regulator [Azoarcus olearius]ANQ86013.1 sigma-54-dependent transcriptional regulator [Azoarcus olearius]